MYAVWRIDVSRMISSEEKTRWSSQFRGLPSCEVDGALRSMLRAEVTI
jgi:hypothetical protein